MSKTVLVFLALISVFGCTDLHGPKFEAGQHELRWEFYLRGINQSNLEYLERNKGDLTQSQQDLLLLIEFVQSTIVNLQEMLGGYNPENGYIFKNLSYEAWNSNSYLETQSKKFEEILNSRTNLSKEEKEKVLFRFISVVQRAEDQKFSLVDISVELDILQLGLLTLILD